MSNNPFGATAPTNNPFVLSADPNDPSNRFPKIDGETPTPSYGGQQQQQPIGVQNTGYWPQQQQQQQQYPQQYPQQTGQPTPQYGGQQLLSAQPTGFRASSSFGQQLESHFGPGPLQSGASAAGYQATSPGYQNVADLDPYASLAALPWAQPVQQQSQQQQQSPTSPMQSSHQDHPRSYVRAHRTELEKWDPYTWCPCSPLISNDDNLTVIL